LPDNRPRSAPRVDDPATVAALRTSFQSAGYERERIKTLLGARDDSFQLAADDAPFLARRLRGTRIGALVRLFLLGSPVPLDETREALAPVSPRDAASLGLLALGREKAHGLVQILPVTDLLMAGDMERAGQPVAQDHVIGVGPASQFLASLTIRRPAELVLDLGTGCGYHALLAARHAKSVIATDVNPRALAFTEFNAALNGIANVECRLGEWFEPVRGERFDLIVANPPFVISPDSTLVYRESPLGGDRVSQMVVEAAPLHLREGGLAHLLANWTHGPDEQWSVPVRSWVAESGCDTWVIRGWTKDPHTYAAMWNQSLSHDPSRFAAAVDRWVAHLRTRGIKAISYGHVLLRKRAGVGRVRADEMSDSVAPDAGAELDALLAVDDRLDGLDDDALLREPVEVTADVRLDQSYRWEGGRFALAEEVLAHDRGLRPRVDVDPVIVAFLAQADGTRTVGEMAAALEPATAEPDAAIANRTSAIAVTRELLRHGFLRFVRRSESP
jgi:methylase of polypeptide subunit release factors